MNQVVNIPNKEAVTSSFKGQITESSVLPKKGQYSHVLKDLHIKYLISLGQLCDDGCTDIIDKNEFIVSKVLI